MCFGRSQNLSKRSGIIKGICPICNKPTGCAIVAGEPPKTCWCMDVKFTKEVMDELDRREIKDCICSDCYEKIYKDVN
ncbi:cysteine-rich CWC family protein [Mycoplasmatota bacterium WC44]